MFLLIIVIIGLLVISFLCSILESVLLSISAPYIQVLIDKKKRSGKMLMHFKEDIDEPITAILTLNTISHTIGAAVSGAIALQLYGSQWMALFSALLTLLILVFSEIIPKTIGARYWKSISPASAYIIQFMIITLKPIVIPVNFFTKLIAPEDPGEDISKGEIYNYFRIGYKQGALKTREFEIAENLLHINEIAVKDIMTPRTVVYWLQYDLTVRDIKKEYGKMQFSRIPLYNPRENSVQGIVLQRDIMNRITQKKFDVSLKSLSVKPYFIPGSLSVLDLLNNLVNKKRHMAVVINEFGDYSGVVTIEDAIESLLGKQIVDEFDPAVDMREEARKKFRKRKIK